MCFNLENTNIFFKVNDIKIKNGELDYSTIPSSKEWAKAFDRDGKLFIEYVNPKELIYMFYLYINTDTEDYKYLQSLVDKQFSRNNKPEFIKLVFENKKAKAIVNKAYFKNLVEIRKNDYSNINEAKFIIDTVKGELELIEKVNEDIREIENEKEKLTQPV